MINKLLIIGYNNYELQIIFSYSLLPTPYSLLPTPYSLLPTPFPIVFRLFHDQKRP
ncbi:MAG: hypothetical protein F6J90_31140 [Moorea sp. SIOASIH]|uniref:hypothetical protein n=1 Tax=Moorena sp. SIOASIH TaxID=2607817 RepID=UPI0013BD2393|nr:hypothetical protein [Moorena sp. SIOASIH]NEO40553.1 hypothetical protein [Moorena sp. SIOASIH]